MLLWRGEPLADVGSEVLARRIPQLTETYLQAVETRIEAEVHLGRHAEVISELRRLTSDQPFREHAHALLMRALYRCGRQGEALAAYQAARRILIGELGSEPGPELHQMHQWVLNRDPGLGAPGPAAAGGPVPAAADGPVPVMPREVPGTVGHFVGRLRELTELDRLLDGPRDGPGAMVISAIGGTAGVGKTALAVQWAHRVTSRFPDGQLYVNLRGYDPEQPVRPTDALAGFLRSLGVPGQDIPAEVDERAARYRSLLAGRRMLVFLDNAREAGQIRPLLPGTPGCVTVVTSRDSLAGLVARHGAARLDLDLLPLTDAVGLLEDLIGERATADPAATQALAEACGRLPLALRVAAELAAARPARPVAELAGALADQQRLELLQAGSDPHTMVRTVFSWSYRQLDADAARAFRLAGLHPG
jgi:hypothetical protein